MRKKPKTPLPAQTVKSHAFPTASVPIADSTLVGQSFMRKKKRNSPDSPRVPRIGIDLMGSDAPEADLLHAVQEFATQLQEPAQLLAFGTQRVLRPQATSSPITYQVVTEEITMEDSPLLAIRRKKDSSLWRGIDMLKRKELDAFVTAGNTGALIALANMRLEMLPGIDRSALLALLPTRDREVAILDVGAHVQCTSEQLIQFAHMGIAYLRSRGRLQPNVGLLNIGTEAKKGTSTLRAAYQELQKLNAGQVARFVGNVEGRDIFTGVVDLLLTDGFTGNVLLKTAEGLSAFLFKELEASALADSGILATLKARLHYAEYPGAILIGPAAIIIKCHGEAKASAFAQSILSAIRLARHDLIAQIQQLTGHSH